MKRLPLHRLINHRAAPARERLPARRRRHLLETLEDRRLLAVIQVTTFEDTVADDDVISLREAVDFANLATGPDTIRFAPALHAGGAATITLSMGQLGVTESLSIIGPGADTLTVSGGSSSRVFELGGPGANTFLLNGLTIADGFSDSFGGGISFADSDDTLQIRSSQFRGNQAESGGAIAASGTLEIAASTFTDNSAVFGGAMSLQNATALLSQVTISGNQAINNGGGIDHFAVGVGATSTLSIDRSTITGNAASFGAGLHNVATDDAGGAKVTISSSIFADSAGSSNIVSELGPVSIVSLGNNLSDDAAAGFDPARGDLLNTDPLLGPLMDNGGPTLTHALQPGSPAIDVLSRGTLLDDFSVNRFSSHYNFFRGSAGSPSNDPLTSGGVANLNVGRGRGGFVWNQGERLRHVGDTVAVALGFNYPISSSEFSVSSAGLGLFESVTGTSLLAELRVESEKTDGQSLRFHDGLDVVALSGEPTGAIHLDATVSSTTASMIELTYRLSGSGFDPIARTRSFGAAELFFGPVAFDVVDDDSVHDNLTFARRQVAAQLAHEYPLDSSLDDARGGPSLVALGGTLTGGGYQFGPNQGLNLVMPNIDPANYSLEIVFSFDELAPQFKKIVDFADLGVDQGLYVRDGDLVFFESTTAATVASGVIEPDVRYRLLLTRDDASDEVTAYLDGREVWRFVDAGGLTVFSSPNQIIRLFQDDLFTLQQEAQGGFIERIRIDNGARTFDQRGEGFDRVSDGDLDGTATMDIGALEFQRNNQRPTFTASNPAAVLEDSGAQTVTGFATFDPGDPSEAGQTVLAYTVSNLSKPSLFASPPAIDVDGNLTYTPAPQAFGLSTFEVTVQDRGGTAGGGQDTSSAQTFAIVVTAVNDAPSFTLSLPVGVNEDSGPQVVPGFAADFDPGPNEDGMSSDSRLLHDEGPDGTVDPLSRDNLNPTDLGRLAHGSNIVRGFINAAQTVGDVDVFTFQIEAGFQLDGLFLLEFDYLAPPPANERAAFLAINDAATFPYNAEQLDINQNPDLDESLFLGGTVFGLDDLPAADGGNLLPRAGTITGRGFAPPLAAGTYTLYIQQTGPANRYSLDFRVTAVSQQAVAAYTISNVSEASLFAVLPSIDTSGTLTFTPAPDANGSATFDVLVRDDGGTANGGIDTSAPLRGTITINAVNDAPTFTASNPAAVLVNSPAQSIPSFVTSFTAGPSDEIAQRVLAYQVTNLSNPALFVSPPVIDSSGGLSYQPAADAIGSSTFDVVVQDDGGVQRGGVDTSSVQTFTIRVLPQPVELDFGDAPGGYPVLLTDDGARHVLGPLFLGLAVDGDEDGQPSAAADGDGADDDGARLLANLVAVDGAMSTASFLIVASQAGLLDGWIDFNGDRDWNDSGEQIAARFPLVAGDNLLPFAIPDGTLPGSQAVRLRVSSAGGLAPTGAAEDGEVEDYLVTIQDGTTSPSVSVELVSADSTVLISNGLIVVRFSIVLFSAPSNGLGLLETIGSEGDETLTLDLGSAGLIPPGGLRLDGRGGENRLSIASATVDLDFTTGQLIAANFQTIDLGQDHSNTIIINATAVERLAPDTGSVTILGGPGDGIRFSDADDWRMGGTSIVDGRFLRSVVRRQGAGGNQLLQVDLPRAWQHLIRVSDVNNNGTVTSGDALLIINELARRLFSDPNNQMLSDPLSVAQWPGLYYDQNGDNRATALDALRVINEVARLLLAQGEAEPDLVDLALTELMHDDETAETRDEVLPEQLQRDAKRLAGAAFSSPAPQSRRDRATDTDTAAMALAVEQAGAEVQSLDTLSERYGVGRRQW